MFFPLSARLPKDSLGLGSHFVGRLIQQRLYDVSIRIHAGEKSFCATRNYLRNVEPAIHQLSLVLAYRGSMTCHPAVGLRLGRVSGNKTHGDGTCFQEIAASYAETRAEPSRIRRKSRQSYFHDRKTAGPGTSVARIPEELSRRR